MKREKAMNVFIYEGQDLLCETQLKSCPVFLANDRHHFAPCRSSAESSPVAAAICPACSDIVPALHELSPRRRRPYRVQRAALKRCPGTFRTPPVNNNNKTCKTRFNYPTTPFNLFWPPIFLVFFVCIFENPYLPRLFLYPKRRPTRSENDELMKRLLIFLNIKSPPVCPIFSFFTILNKIDSTVLSQTEGRG